MSSKYFGKKIDGISYKRRDGAYALILSSTGKIATVRTPRGYFLPGGGIEDGESHEEALIREAREETGYELTVNGYIDTYSQFLLGMTKSIYYELVGNFYECQFGDFVCCKTEDDHELIWMDIESASETLALEYQRHAVDVYAKRKFGRHSMNVSFAEMSV